MWLSRKNTLFVWRGLVLKKQDNYWAYSSLEITGDWRGCPRSCCVQFFLSSQQVEGVTESTKEFRAVKTLPLNVHLFLVWHVHGSQETVMVELSNSSLLVQFRDRVKIRSCVLRVESVMCHNFVRCPVTIVLSQSNSHVIYLETSTHL